MVQEDGCTLEVLKDQGSLVLGSRSSGVLSSEVPSSSGVPDTSLFWTIVGSRTKGLNSKVSGHFGFAYGK